MPRINLTVQPELYDYILQHKPKSLSVARFCSLLVEQQASVALDAAGTLGLASASEASPSSSYSSSKEEELKPKTNKTNTRARDAYAAKVIDVDLVPDDLLDCQQLLPEFWAVKKGTRSQGVWNRVCGKLRGWTPEQRREALERAIASGWGDVFEPPAAKPVQQGFTLSATGTPLTVNEQIAAAAIRNIRAMEERRAAA